MSDTKRVTGIEPATTAWKAVVLPLNYTRVNGPCWALTNLAKGPEALKIGAIFHLIAKREN